MAEKVLVLASGGLDSSVVLALYKELGYDVHVMYIDYENKNMNAEIEHLEALCAKLGISVMEKSHVIRISMPFSSSSILNGGNGEEYVEMRNLIFLANAISLAQALSINTVAVGFIRMIKESNYYPDTSPEFVDNMNVMSLQSCGIQVVAPLMNLTKQEVYRLGRKLSLNLTDTFSCNFSEDGVPCGKCADCRELQRIIKEEHIPDDENPFIKK